MRMTGKRLCPRYSGASGGKYSSTAVHFALNMDYDDTTLLLLDFRPCDRTRARGQKKPTISDPFNVTRITLRRFQYCELRRLADYRSTLLAEFLRTVGG